MAKFHYGNPMKSHARKKQVIQTKEARAETALTDGLEWWVAIIGYDRKRWNQYLNAYARDPGEAQRLMDDGRRETHFVQYTDDESRRRSFFQALLKIEWRN